ncbi:uncharacterized protein [Glycine max]|uniref:uncharacterized protein n=1 Tax=Glycine max TaxID=3847 RepID=UPI0003DEAD95|nr:uncharacterized protein LOC102663087 [Glycine max]|eukprot:XP_006604987.1 uncharacterized protein LOC102663087 [Glycine max]
MSEEVDMNVENEEDVGVKVEHVDCSDVFNTFQLFATHDEILHWAQSVAHEIGFVVVIMRLDTNTSVRGRTSFLLIACKRSGEYRPKKNDLVRTCTDSRKCGYQFKLHAKPILGGEGWMVKLICGIHNHKMAKSFVGHSYTGRLTKDEKLVVADMTKSMFRGLFMKVDALPEAIVIHRDLSLINAVKTVFSDATNLLFRFHIDKNVKAKCKTLAAQKNA